MHASVPVSCRIIEAKKRCFGLVLSACAANSRSSPRQFLLWLLAAFAKVQHRVNCTRMPAPDGEAAPASATLATAATPADTKQQRPRLSPEELAARGEAPVKPEFLRTTAARVHVGAVAGRRLASSSNGGGSGGGAAASGAPPSVAAAGPGENQREVRQKSKKQIKKVGRKGAELHCRAARGHM